MAKAGEIQDQDGVSTHKKIEMIHIRLAIDLYRILENQDAASKKRWHTCTLLSLKVCTVFEASHPSLLRWQTAANLPLYKTKRSTLNLQLFLAGYLDAQIAAGVYIYIGNSVVSYCSFA